MAAPMKKPILRKILYEKQGFPDNYVDDSFLQELQKNVNIRVYGVSEAIVETVIVSEEVCSVVLFAVVFTFLETERLSWKELLALDFVTFSLFYLLDKHVNGRNKTLETITNEVKLGAVYVGFSFGFAPILKTLTETISSDTVYAMATMTMILHLVTYDYGPSFPIVSASLSFNAAIFAVVCLASRLKDSQSTFVLLVTSVVMFSFLPRFRRNIHENYGRPLRVCVTVTSIVITTVALFAVSTISTVLFVILVTFVNLVCPIWFVRLQRYKENIYGPWDEAILKMDS